MLAENDRLSAEGLRVSRSPRDIDPNTTSSVTETCSEVGSLTLLALIAIVDPPRKEARDAIARCKGGGDPAPA